MNRALLVRLSAWMIPFALTCPSLAQTRYTVENIGSLGGKYVTPLALNNHGTVVAFSATTPTGNIYHMFTYNSGQRTDLGTLGGNGFVNGAYINDSNQIAAGIINNNPLGSPFNQELVLYSNGQVTNLNPSGNYYTVPASINNSGQIAGQLVSYADAPLGGYLYFPSPAIFSANGTGPTILNTNTDTSSFVSHVNNLGVAVGGQTVLNQGYSIAVEFQNGTAIDLLKRSQHLFSVANAINDKGDVAGEMTVGYGYDRFGNSVAIDDGFVYSNGQYVDIGRLGTGFRSTLGAINNSGVAVGGADTGLLDANNNPIYHAIVYQNGSLYDLNNLIDNPLSLGLDYLVGSLAINDAGQILLEGESGIGADTTFQGFLLTPTPEPGFGVLFLAGTLLVLRRRGGRQKI